MLKLCLNFNWLIYPRVKIHNERVDFQVGSRIGSLKNVKHRPGGGDKKIFDDKEYLKQMGDVGLMTRSGSSSLNGSTWDSSTLVDERNAPKSLNFESPKSKKSFSSPGSSYQSQMMRKLVILRMSLYYFLCFILF